MKMNSPKRIYVPSTATNEEMEGVAAKLFSWGYSVKKGKEKKDKATFRYIEFIKEED